MLRTESIHRPEAIGDLLDAKLIAQLDPLDIASRKIFAGKMLGERRSKKRGQSVEFADHRPYVSGDDLRRIDWNIFGRLDRLFMKIFMEEEDLALHLVVDASASADCGEPSKFLFMQRAAMALGYVGLVNLNRVAATFMGGQGVADGAAAPGTPSDASVLAEGAESAVEAAPARGAPALRALRDLRGKRRLHDLARFMCSVRPGGALNFRDAAERIALTRRGKGAMVLFSDFFFKDGYEPGLRMLVGRGFDLFCVQVLSPQELEPPITGDLRLRDIEDGDRAEVTISAPLLKRYKANLAAYCQQLRDFCTRRDITLITIPSDTPVSVLVLDYLRRRGLVK